MDRKVVAKAIESLDVKRLEKGVGVGGSLADAEDLLQLVLRSNRMIVRKQDAAAESRRDAFLAGLKTVVETRFAQGSGVSLKRVTALIVEIEAGYRDVQNGVPMSAISSLPTTRQISAVIERALQEGRILAQETHEALKKPGWQLGMPLVAFDGDGNPYDPDGVRTALVRNLGATLKFQMGRFGRTKTPEPLILPCLEQVSDEETYKAGTALLASSGLRRWRRIEERVRFWGGSVQSFDKSQLHSDLKCDILRVFKPEILPYFDFIANARLTDVLIKSFQETLLSNPQNVHSQATELAPVAFLSLDEHAAFAALRGLLGLEAGDTSAKFQGLSVAEWVRGYAALRLVAANGEELDPPQVKFRFEADELEQRLVQAGLTVEAARIFLDYVTFGDHSDDLFDCPVIGFEDGSNLLFGPGAAHSVLPQVILSNLNHLGETFTDKGRAFEQTVRKNFERAGLKTYHIHAFREGEEYEVDVVVPWGDKLFLFECKSDGLSDHDPVAAYNFEKARDKHIAQIKRQVAGLRKHSDMLQEVGIPDADKLEWVPVLLYLFPYAIPTENDDVSVADWAGLGRFFGKRQVHLPPVMHQDKYHTAVANIREAEWPTPAELKIYLHGPFQMGIKLACIEPREELIWLQDRRLARGVELDMGPLEFETAIELFPHLELKEMTKPSIG